MWTLAALLLLPLAYASCPAGSTEFNGYCYKFFAPQSEFEQSEITCNTQSYAVDHLVSIMNAFENNIVASLIPESVDKVWIGAEWYASSFRWTDGLPFGYNHVDPQSPPGGECLVFVRSTKKWARASCTENHSFVCKFTLTPAPVISNSTGFAAAAQYLLNGMDPSVNPCDDFYQFTCGTFLNNTVLNGRSRVGVYDTSQTNVNNQTAAFLASSVNSGSSLTERITKAAYDACVYNYNQGTVADKSKVIYSELTKAFGVSELPLFNPSFSGISNAQLFSAVGYFEGTHALGTLMGSWSTVDYKKVTDNALFVDQPGLMLPRGYYVLPQFLTQMENHVQDYVEILTLFAMDNGKSISQADILAAANDIVNFEIHIALASWPDEEMRNYKEMYNPYSLTGLQAAYPNIAWKQYFDQLFAGLGKDSSLLMTKNAVIGEPSYFAWLNAIVTGTQFKQSTIINYIVVQAVYDSADFLAGAYGKIAERKGINSYAIRNGKGPSHIGARRERRKFDSIGDMCLDIVMAYMPYGPGYVYVKAQTPQSRAAILADVKVQTGLIIDNFKGMIGSLPWMSTYSKNNAYTKAGALLKNYGFPTMFKDLQDASAVDAYHNTDYATIATMDQTMYWQIQMTLKKGLEVRESLRLLLAPADRANFLQSPAMVNAWYQPERNSITFPYAAFNPPYYNVEWPQAFNYGGQGGTGGHELTHGYDDEGVQFGPDGSLSDCDTFHCGWMDLNSTSGFTDMAQCVVTQFTTQCCPVKTGNVHCANGATTQGENIADLGGQQAAHRAYRQYVQTIRNGVEEPRLPGLEEYTPNQIFWITYGYSWCMKQSTASLVSQLLTNPHSPAVCRTNNVMQDIPEFGQDFNCPRGSSMYPQPAGRCKVWVGV